MAYGEFYVERQGWARWPKVLMMCRRHGSMEDGSVSVERRRYVPERTCEIDYERHCSNCGVHVHKSAVLARKNLDGGTWTVVSKPASYCPNCGARVVDGKEGA